MERGADVSTYQLEKGVVETARHRTAYLAAGPQDGPLLFFLHGCPDLSIFWRRQLAFFSQRGWRCIAPDMRGFGGSSVPGTIAAYALRESQIDMIELHDALGGRPAIWVGHDWGSAVVWSIAAHQSHRCRGVVSLTIPYFARGFGVDNYLPLIDRALYPQDVYPAGQWEYWRFYQEHFARAVEDFETDVAATFRVLLQSAPPIEPAVPAITAHIRNQGGCFGTSRRPPAIPRDTALLSEEDFATLVAAYERTGFSSAIAWYLNDDENIAYAAEAPNFGRLSVPSLFVHAARDAVCDTVRGRFADLMREDLVDLTEEVIDAGHLVMLERPDETNDALGRWLAALDERPR